MKKRTLSVIIAAVLLIAMVFAVVGCSDNGTCELCDKKDVKVKTLKIEGEKSKLCNECYDEMEALLKLAEAFG
jgi:dissimilatory sulfite reductase (desulfoviridin) alpha/beta subunit